MDSTDLASDIQTRQYTHGVRDLNTDFATSFPHNTARSTQDWKGNITTKHHVPPSNPQNKFSRQLSIVTSELLSILLEQYTRLERKYHKETTHASQPPAHTAPTTTAPPAPNTDFTAGYVVNGYPLRSCHHSSCEASKRLPQQQGKSTPHARVPKQGGEGYKWGGRGGKTKRRVQVKIQPVSGRKRRILTGKTRVHRNMNTN